MNGLILLTILQTCHKWHPFFEGDIDECSFNELIDTLFKIETKMNRFIIEGKVITNAKWQKFFGELAITKTCEWPTKRDVILWEEIVEIKALPIGGS